MICIVIIALLILVITTSVKCNGKTLVNSFRAKEGYGRTGTIILQNSSPNYGFPSNNNAFRPPGWEAQHESTNRLFALSGAKSNIRSLSSATVKLRKLVSDINTELNSGKVNADKLKRMHKDLVPTMRMLETEQSLTEDAIEVAQESGGILVVDEARESLDESKRVLREATDASLSVQNVLELR